MFKIQEMTVCRKHFRYESILFSRGGMQYEPANRPSICYTKYLKIFQSLSIKMYLEIKNCTSKKLKTTITKSKYSEYYILKQKFTHCMSSIDDTCKQISTSEYAYYIGNAHSKRVKDVLTLTLCPRIKFGAG